MTLADRLMVRRSPPDVLLCDLGNVLINFWQQGGNPEFAGKCSVSPEEIDEFFRSDLIFHKYEKDKRSEVASREFFEGMKDRFGYSGGYDEFRHDFCQGFSSNSDTHNLICELKVAWQDTKFCILSNLNELHHAYIREHWPGVFANFWKCYFSFEVGHRKPEPEIYKYVLREEGMLESPHRCLFIDDVRENVLAAQELKIHAILFQGAKNLRETLKSKYNLLD